MLNSIEKIKRQLRTEQELEDQELALLHALYQPVVDAAFFSTNPLATSWLETDCRCKASTFHASLKPVAQYYAATNPALSAALWAIWQCLDRMRPHSGFASMKPEEQEADFVRYRSIVTNAVIQFADGDSFTYVSLQPNKSPNTRKQLTSRALDCLQDRRRVRSAVLPDQPIF